MARAKKRIVKNPETFREKVQKANQPEEKKHRVITGILFAPFRALKDSYLKASKIKSLKPLFTVLSFIGKIIWPPYFRNSFKELQGVTWPTPKMSVRLTYAVLAFAVIFGVSIAVVDYGLGKVFKVLLLK